MSRGEAVLRGQEMRFGMGRGGGVGVEGCGEPRGELRDWSERGTTSRSDRLSSTAADNTPSLHPVGQNRGLGDYKYNFISKGQSWSRPRWTSIRSHK